VRDFVTLAAAELGITIAFEGEGEAETGRITGISNSGHKCKVGDIVVRVDPRYFRPTEVETLLGDPSRAFEMLGWKPKISFAELVREMAQADYESARRDALVKAHGYRAFDYHE